MPLFLVRVTTKGHTDVSGTDSQLRLHRCLKAVLLPGHILIYVAMLLPKAIVTYRPMLPLTALSVYGFITARVSVDVLYHCYRQWACGFSWLVLHCAELALFLTLYHT